jgi:hypothetical protein
MKYETRQMITKLQHSQPPVLLWFFGGFCFLTIVFLSPHPGYLNGESFFTVARSSPWEKWGDWAAAWCSLKVILFSVGVFLVLFALGESLRLCAKKTLCSIVLTMTAAPIAGVWIGLFYFIKAVF